MVAQTQPGTHAAVKALRDGKQKNLKVTLEELPAEQMARLNPPGGPIGAGSDALDGVDLGDVDARARRQLGLPSQVDGALVMNVEPGSKAATAGLRPGDVILEVNRKTVVSAEEAAKQIRESKGEPLLLRVWTKSGSHYVALDTPKEKKRKEDR